MSTVRSYIKGKQKRWDDNLSLLAGAIRSCYNKHTGFSANMMMLGREVMQPVDLILGTATMNSEDKEPVGYVQELRETLQGVHQIARENLMAAQIRQKRDYDMTLFQKTNNVGDAVYRLNPATKVGQCTKLKPYWQGPFIISKVLSPVLYKITGRKKELTIHHDQLKLCEDRNLPKWMKYARSRLLNGHDYSNEGNVEEDEEVDLSSLFQDTYTSQLQDLGQDYLVPSAGFPGLVPDDDANSEDVGSDEELDRIDGFYNPPTIQDLSELKNFPNLDTTIVYQLDDSDTMLTDKQDETENKNKYRIRKPPSYLKDYLVSSD